ncbi:MAG: cytochrome c biogenesis protein CcdA [Alphaproteobacteria bacterium]|nr:MAG: cytochrome c biogenesis protein CcdA [Alphaproteobacteria bacterium]
MDILLGYLAGVLTLINPCVLPVLPVVLASALQAGRLGPVWLAAGMSLSFVALGLGVSALGPLVGLDAETVSDAAAVLMIAFGLALLVPRVGGVLAGAMAGVSARADQEIAELDASAMRGQFLGGMLLGAVWSPCVGPTLGGAIGLAAAGQDLVRAGAIMTAFALGISTVLVLLAYGARAAIQRRAALLRAIAARSRPVLGVVFILVGVMILTRVNQMLEGWLLDRMPAWLIDLTVSI